MPKTGTTSLGVALEQLGYADCDSHMAKGFDSYDAAIGKGTALVKPYPVGQVPESVEAKVRDILKQLSHDIDNKLYKTKWSTRAGHEMVHQKTVCNSYSDYPLGHASGIDLRLKTILFPGGKYIWVDRPFDDWHDSFVAWKIKNKGKKPTCSKDHMREYIGARRQELVDYRNIHPHKVLMVNITNLNWKHVLGFLDLQPGCVPPEEEFPDANVNVENLKGRVTEDDGSLASLDAELEHWCGFKKVKNSKAV